MMSSERFRREHTPQQRAYPLLPYIDPGFVNHRLVETFVGPEGMHAISQMIAEIPPQTPDWQRSVRTDHIFTRVALKLCQHLETPSLNQVVCGGDFQPGQIVSSTETLEGDRGISEQERASVRWLPSYETTNEVVFELSTRHIASDTLRYLLTQNSLLSFIARLDRVEGATVYFAPLIIGMPWLDPPPEGVPFGTMFLHYDFYEHFIEDIDEFSKVGTVSDDLDWSAMRQISEAAFKACLCQTLGDPPRKDWGGETSDHFTTHLHLQGRRLTAAFLLKGPGRGFSCMEMIHLGKSGDQIYRLSLEPAEMLIVQHCHEIGSAVRATLRAFAVQPNRSRRYLLIDGRDSFRLLFAYKLLEKALRLSVK